MCVQTSGWLLHTSLAIDNILPSLFKMVLNSMTAELRIKEMIDRLVKVPQMAILYYNCHERDKSRMKYR